jgi:sugar phosphate isomerase/epimerase
MLKTQDISVQTRFGLSFVQLAGQFFIKNLINKYNMEIPVVSTGQVFAGSKLCFTDPDPAKRAKVIEVFKGLVEVASEFGAMVNMGRVRGFI